MKLYDLLNPVEKKACKALDIRNVHTNDLTVEELGQMNDVLNFQYDDDQNQLGCVRSLKEIYARQTHIATRIDG